LKDKNAINGKCAINKGEKMAINEFHIKKFNQTFDRFSRAGKGMAALIKYLYKNACFPLLTLLLFVGAIHNYALAQTTTVTLTTGTSWTVPANVTKITVEAWGGGGGSGGMGWNFTNGGTGGSSTIFGITAGGGSASNGANTDGSRTNGGAGGSATGGAINLPGNSGNIGTLGDPSYGGNGGSSPNGGTTKTANSIGTNNNYTPGIDGNSPGGGAAGGAFFKNTAGQRMSIGGGGGGAYSQIVQAVTPNQSVSFSVGSGGIAGIGVTNATGGAGANGQIRITYSTFNLSTTAVNASPICSLSTANITISSTAAGLPNGSYTVTYTLTGNEAGTYTTNVTVSSNSATFSTIALTGSTTVTITNIENASCGNNIIANNTVNVTVNASVGGTISGGNSPVCSGSSTGTMTVSGYTGTILAWELSQNSGAWGSMGGNNSTTFSQNTWESGIWEYRVSVQNGSCPVAYSSIRTINVDPITVGGTLGKSHYDPICEGASTPTLTLAGYTGSITRWEKRLNSGSWTNISHTSPTYSETPTTTGTWDYRVLVKSGVCNETYSSTISVTVNATPGVVPGNNPEVCQNTTSTPLSYSSPTGNPNNYNIIFDASAITAGFSNQNGNLNNPITVQIPYSVATGVYNAILRVGTYSPVCSSPDYPFTITIVDEITGTPGPISGSASVIQEQAGVVYSIPAINYATSYGWSYTGTGATINGTSNSITIDFSASATSGNLTVYATNACGNGSISTPFPITVTSSCTPPATPTPTSNSPVCTGSTLNLTTPAVGGATYSWTGPNSFASNEQNPSISNVTTAASGTYSITVTVSGCTSAAGTTDVTVLNSFTAGVILNTGETICYNGDPSVIGNSTDASGGDGSITYKWQSSTDAGFPSPTDISSNTATYDPPANLTESRWYRRQAHDGTCNTSFTTSTGIWAVTVRPNFTAGAISTTGQTICYDGDPSVIVSTTAASGGDNTITYQWQYSTDAGFSSPVDISSNSATYDPPANLTENRWYRRQAHDGTCNTGWNTSTGVWAVDIYPLPTANASLIGTYEICPETNHSPFNPNNDGPPNPGTTYVDIHVTRTGGTGNWEFDFVIQVMVGSDPHPEYVIDTVATLPAYIDSGSDWIVVCGDNDDVYLRFEILNVPGNEIDVVFLLEQIRNDSYDGSPCTPDMSNIEIKQKIFAMPDVGPFD